MSYNESKCMALRRCVFAEPRESCYKCGWNITEHSIRVRQPMETTKDGLTRFSNKNRGKCGTGERKIYYVDRESNPIYVQPKTGKARGFATMDEAIAYRNEQEGETTKVTCNMKEDCEK